jgi:hypothetical protein
MVPDSSPMVDTTRQGPGKVQSWMNHYLRSARILNPKLDWRVDSFGASSRDGVGLGHSRYRRMTKVCAHARLLREDRDMRMDKLLFFLRAPFRSTDIPGVSRLPAPTTELQIILMRLQPFL